MQQEQCHPSLKENQPNRTRDLQCADAINYITNQAVKKTNESMNQHSSSLLLGVLEKTLLEANEHMNMKLIAKWQATDDAGTQEGERELF